MRKSIQLGVVLSAFCAVLAANGVELPHVFGDNMVLQRGQRVPVWGKGAPGEKVTVSFAGQSVSAVVGADCRWKLFLAPLKESADGAEFRVRDANEIVLKNVVVGEGWFCSG